MKLLVIGGGGREHAIAKKLLSSMHVEDVFCAPGNAGMKRDGIKLVEIDQDNHQGLIDFVKSENISWSIVGPEIPLLNGIVDDFQAEGLSIFGPRKAAAQIEASKTFAKNLMVKNNIPTADYKVFDDFEAACLYVQEGSFPVVIKANGLAAGKGVVIAETVSEAQDALSLMMKEKKYGDSSATVVIEEFLTGEEFSLMAFVDSDKVYPMAISQDHKRLLEGDLGPNTGGMGAYSPVPHIAQSNVDEAIERILVPAAKGMIDNGTPFTGILYAGVMITAGGVKTIEFNARFGDPETQVVLNRLESDLARVITDLLGHKDTDLKWKADGINLGVVVAAEGYPEDYAKHIPLTLPDSFEETEIYFAGVTESERKLVSNGGRIYLIESYGGTVDEAQDTIYSLLKNIDTTGCVYRKDIGNRALS